MAVVECQNGRGTSGRIFKLSLITTEVTFNTVIKVIDPF